MTRFLIAVCAGLLICSGVLGWLAVSRSERVGVLEQANGQLVKDLQSAEQQKLLLFKRNEQDQVLLVAAERNNRSWRTKLFKSERKLEEVLSDEECADTDLPGDAVDGLLWPESDRKARGSP
ncbi:MAG: hypothetical protein ACPGF7_13660 [Pontibacterium sp.]